MTTCQVGTEVDFSVTENNDVVVSFTATHEDGTAFDLTGATLAFFRKVLVQDTDSAALYTTANGKLVVTNAAQGKFNVSMPAADLARGGVRYRYHVDATIGGAVTTVGHGSMLITDV